MTTAPWETPENNEIVLSNFEAKPTLAADVVEQMKASIHAQLVDARFDDPALAPDLMAKVLTELAAAVEVGGRLGLWAGNLLQSLWHRAESGVPFGEPVEPAWSLDPEPRGPKRGE